MPADPRCPDCGEPVGARTDYCMHCGATVDGGEGALASEGVDPESGAGTPDTGAPGRGPWLDPDGLLDDSLTVLVGVGFGLLLGIPALLVGAVVTGSAWGALLGVVAMLVATGYLITRHSVHETARVGCYATAAALLCVPTVALTDAAKGGSFAGQVVLFAVAEVPFAIGAALVAGFGYWVGRRAPPTDGV